MGVRHLKRRAIDDKRWNGAIHADADPLPYGLTWWLDAATGGRWDGLVLDDYRAVMPLPRLRRMRILPVLIRPPYTQQLGPFGNFSAAEAGQLLLQLPRSLQLALPLRADLPASVIPDRFASRRRINYVLDLSPDYPTLTARFPGKLQAFLRKSEADRLETMSAGDFVEWNRRILGPRTPLTERDFGVLRSLIERAMAENCGQCWQLREGGELLAAGFFPRLAGRTINLSAVSTERGRKRRGMSRLLALVMRDGAGTPGNRFDFEGSELPGVREFFAKFGGRDVGYWLIEERFYGLG